MAKCCVIGMGYIGLPTASILADVGHQVVGVDVDPEKIEKIKQGIINIKEPDLENLFKKVVSSGALLGRTKPIKSDVFIIAVPTPFKDGDFDTPEPNLEFVLSAVKALCKVLEKGNLIIIESTSPVGTTKQIANLIEEITKFNLQDIKLAYCPERVLPGKILKELIENDRVIGGINYQSALECKKFYETFCEGQISITDSATAELVKLSENSYRDVNIAYANELSMICKNFSINPNELINLANKHPRVNILEPGCGVGGHCIAVDPWFIAFADPTNSLLIQSARKVNLYKTDWVIEEISEKINQMQIISDIPIKVGCFGLTFKPDIDDLRESPALKIANSLVSRGYDVSVCEPNINIQKGLKLLKVNELIEVSDLLVFLVAHKEFQSIDTIDKEVINLCGLKLNT